MFKFSIGLVVLSLLAAAPALAEAPANPAKPAVNTVKDAAVEKAKGAVDATKAKANAAQDAVADKAKGATDAARDKAHQAASTALVDINTATVETLATLHGIGPVRAEAIVKGRPYKGKDDLVTRKIIPENVYKDIKEQIIARQK